MVSHLFDNFKTLLFLFETLYDRRGWEEQVQGEAIIKGNKGTFDASKITGTFFFLVGHFFPLIVFKNGNEFLKSYLITVALCVLQTQQFVSLVLYD